MLKLEHLARARKGTCIFLRGSRGNWWIREDTINVDGMENPVYRAAIYYMAEDGSSRAIEGVVKYAIEKDRALEALLPTINAW